MSNTKNKMLIDATHPEETRVVVLRNGRIEEFDWESAARKLLRGNIYLAKVTRVEPSLQAAFVDYGGNRHGFLAFSEIHPDYYQIPMADRQALLAEEARAEEAKAKAEAAEDADEDADDEASEADDGESTRDVRGRRGEDAGSGAEDDSTPQHSPAADRRESHEDQPAPSSPAEHSPSELRPADEHGSWRPERRSDDEPWREQLHEQHSDPVSSMPLATPVERIVDDQPSTYGEPRHGDESARHGGGQTSEHEETSSREFDGHNGGHNGHHGEHRDQDGLEETSELGSRVVEVVETEGGGATEVETVGAEDAVEEIPERPRRHARQYKIQEVIRRRQIILVQVVKEERGNKGAALTTYLSLAGRYTVLMPNTARGGGISRKIAQSADRKRLRKIVTELEVPKGMGLIVRTAGASRTKPEIKRDFEYLLRLWESVRDLTLRSTAPALVYEEGDLIKRSIRDLYTKEIDEIAVAGEQAYGNARDFMQMLMPSHVGNVIAYRAHEPLFTKYQIERQLNAMFSPFVTLRSGGYIVINQTEALVSIDINSGKSTREHNIEDTAFKTNLEASEEIARQLKLRDLAGLIVIDYIDMEEKRNNRAVERRLKECLRHDRARIQVGRISHFGLLEMSRQRLRPGVLEGSTSQCPHCQGTGTIRSTESVALGVLRGIEDKMISGERFNVIAHTTGDVASYILNQKRHFLNDMESRYGVTITILASDKVHGANFLIERGPAVEERQPVRRADVVQMDASHHGPTGSLENDAQDEDEALEDERPDSIENSNLDEIGGDDARDDARSEAGADGERRGRRRRRRRRGRNGAEIQAGGEAGQDAHEHGGDSDDEPEEADRPTRHGSKHDTSQARDDGEPSIQEVDTDTDVETIGGDGNGGDDRDPGDAPSGDGEQRDARGDGEGRRRRRGRRGGRRGGRDREQGEGAAERAQPFGNGDRPMPPIARPDEWLHAEPTVGDLAAEERRRTGQAEQPPYYSGHALSPQAPAERTGGEQPAWRQAGPSSHGGGEFPHVTGGAAAIAATTVAAKAATSFASMTPSESTDEPAPHAATPSSWHRPEHIRAEHIRAEHIEVSHSTTPSAAQDSPVPTGSAEPVVSAWTSPPPVASNGNHTITADVAAEPIAESPAPIVTTPSATEPVETALAPEPVATEPPPPPEPPRPRKSGWWSRKDA